MPAPGATFPYLMQVIQTYLDGGMSEAWALANLRQFESFLVRRSFAGFEPTGLHRLFKTIFRTTDGDPAKFVTEIDKQYTIIFPSDEKFVDDILNRPLYGKKLAKYILEEYEMSLVGGDSYVSPDGFSIDHIMPQTPTAYWREIVSPPEEYSRLKDTWGNLVPLTLPANSQKGQMGWEDLMDYYLTESYFKTTRRVAAEYGRWDAGTIRQRGEALAAWAVTRWPKRVEP